jgi:hypothetical protein
MQERFDRLVFCARHWRRELLNRIVRLGGDVTATMGTIAVTEEVKRSLENTKDLLDQIFDVLDAAMSAAVSAQDHPTMKMLMMLLHEVDHKRSKVEAWLNQVKDMRDNYLVTLV